MFPDARHARHRPRAARPVVPARQRRPGRGGRPHPRPRGPHRRPGLLAARPVGARLRLGADPGPGPQPGGGGGSGRPGHLRRGPRRREAADRALRGRVHPRHPLGARTDSPPPSTPPRGSSCTRATSSSTSRRSTAASPTWPTSAPWPTGPASACCCRTRPTPRSPGSPTPRRNVGATLRRLFAVYAGRRLVVTCFASHIHRVQQVIDAALATRPQGGHPRPVHGQERRAGPPARSARTSPTTPSSTSRTSTAGPGRGVRDLDRIPGRAAVGAVAHGGGGEQVAEAAPGRRRRHQRPSHPRQRVGGGPGHRRPAPARAPRSSTPAIEPVHVSGHARQGELQTLLSVARPEWFIPVHGEYRHLVTPRPAGRRAWGCDEDKALLCEDGDSVVLDDDGMRRGDDGARRLPLRRRHRRRRRPRGAARPAGPGRGRRGGGGGHRRPPRRPRS